MTKYLHKHGVSKSFWQKKPNEELSHLSENGVRKTLESVFAILLQTNSHFQTFIFSGFRIKN